MTRRTQAGSGRPMSPRVLGVIVLTTVKAACGGEATPPDVQTVETVGDATIARSEGPGVWGAGAVLVPEVSIGELDGPEEWNQDQLWGGLRNRDLEVISTDHCPFCPRDQKELGRNDFSRIPNGGPGVENRMSLIFHYGVNAGRIDVNRFVELTSTAPARIFGMFPRKGTIAVGSDADIVIFDPEREVTISRSDPRTHHMNVDYSAYEGFQVRGCTETVLLRGRIVVDNGEYVGRAGDGQFIRRGPYGGASAPLAASDRRAPYF